MILIQVIRIFFIIVNKVIIRFDIPNIFLSLKQRIIEEKEITFINLGINKIIGNLEINSIDKKPEVLSVLAYNIELTSYDCNYKQLILKHKIASNKDFNVLKIEIFFREEIEGKNSLKKKKQSFL